MRHEEGKMQAFSSNLRWLAHFSKSHTENCGAIAHPPERVQNPSVDAITIDSYSQSLRSQLDGASEVASSDFED